jgi:hypothetical protein
VKKHEEVNNQNSCLNRAMGDEMLFILLGRDLAAPAAVEASKDLTRSGHAD